MHTVVETAAFLSSAKAEGLSVGEIKVIVDTVAANPLSGEMIVGSGGCRKVRFAGRGKGKSGGHRVVTWFGGERLPVFLVAMLSKGSQGNFTDAQVNQMKAMVQTFAEAYRPRLAK